MEKQGLEHEGDEGDGEVTEDDIKAKIMKLTNVSSSTSEYILQALLAAQEKDNLDAIIEEDRIQYELNPSDVIKEEEYEESTLGDITSRKETSQMEKMNSNNQLVNINTETDLVEALLKEEGLLKENESNAKEQLKQNLEKVKKQNIAGHSDEEDQNTEKAVPEKAGRKTQVVPAKKAVHPRDKSPVVATSKKEEGPTPRAFDSSTLSHKAPPKPRAKESTKPVTPAMLVRERTRL